MAVPDRETPDVQSVARAAALLRALGDAGAPVPVRALAAATGLPAATVSRLLATLERAGLVARDEAGTYALGLGLVALAARVPAIESLRRVAGPLLAELRDATGETASLLVQVGDDALYVEQAQSAHVLRLAGWAGRRIPLAGTAAGAALAAGDGPRVAVDAVEAGVTAVACAIAGSTPPAALSVAGPSSRLAGPALARAESAVVAAARAVAVLLSPAPSTRRSA